jgi:hypothetical protein
VDPIIDLAPGAEQNPLATHFAARVRSNLTEKPHKITDFQALRGSVQLVADDIPTSITMRFDLGRLTLHDGLIGIPTVTFCASRATLLALSELPLSRWLKLPSARRKNVAGMSNLYHVLGELLRGDLKVYGLISHPRLVLRLLRVISRHG